MKMKRTLLAALGILACIAVPVFAAGFWPNLPIVGGASYCGGFATGTTGQVCTTTVPAGPASVTGNELVPADTQLSQGRAPQTVLLPMAALNAQPLSYTALGPATATNAISMTTNQYGGMIIVGSAALSPVTITLPPAPIDRQYFRLSSTQTIATLNVNALPGGATVSNTPTALTVSTTGAYGYEFVYRSANRTWYRTQ